MRTVHRLWSLQGIGAVMLLAGMEIGCGEGIADDDWSDDATGEVRRVCADDGNPCTVERRAGNRCYSDPVADGTSCPSGTCASGRCESPPDGGSVAPDAQTPGVDAGVDAGADAGTAPDASSPACTMNVGPSSDLSAVIQAVPNQSQTTVICLADGDYLQNVTISGKTNLVLRGTRAARLIEPSGAALTAQTYYGATVRVTGSTDIALEGMQILHLRNYDPSVFHKVTYGVYASGSTNVTLREVKVSASGKSAIVADKSTMKLMSSEAAGFYFVIASINGADVFTEGGTITHIRGDGHAFFWVSGGGTIYFRNPVFVFQEFSGFTGVGGDATLHNVIVVDNPTLVNTTTGSLLNMINQHPNYDNLQLYWLGPRPTTLRYDPARHYFGTFWFDPYVDVTRGTGPSYRVKYCEGAAAATSVQCIVCASTPGTYSSAFSTEAEYQQYFANDCSTISEVLPAGFRR